MPAAHRPYPRTTNAQPPWPLATPTRVPRPTTLQQIPDIISLIGCFFFFLKKKNKQNCGPTRLLNQAEFVSHKERVKNCILQQPSLLENVPQEQPSAPSTHQRLRSLPATEGHRVLLIHVLGARCLSPASRQKSPGFEGRKSPFSRPPRLSQARAMPQRALR